METSKARGRGFVIDWRMTLVHAATTVAVILAWLRWGTSAGSAVDGGIFAAIAVLLLVGAFVAGIRHSLPKATGTTVPMLLLGFCGSILFVMGTFSATSSSPVYFIIGIFAFVCAVAMAVVARRAA